MGKHKFYKSFWTIKHIRNGKEIWSIKKQNSLADEGEESILESFFRGNASFTPAIFYVRLCNDTIVETDTLASILNEPSGNGYSTPSVERSTVGFPTKDTFGGNARITSKEVIFTASGGDIGPVTNLYLATTSNNTGKLIAFLALPLSRLILDGDSMIIQFEIILD